MVRKLVDPKNYEEDKGVGLLVAGSEFTIDFKSSRDFGNIDE